MKRAKKLYISLPKSFLKKITPLDWALLEEFEKKESPIKDYVTAVVLRIVLTNSSISERERFAALVESDQEKAGAWVAGEAEKYQKEIYEEISTFFSKLKKEFKESKDKKD